MAFKLRKRVLLTIALTALMLVISHDIWLIRRPIRTEFDIAGAQGAEIEVQLNRKDNNEFLNSKINKASSIVKTNDLKHIIIKNKTSKRAKRFRLEFSNLEIGKTFEIKDISLHFKKCKLNELDKFVAEKADLTTKDGTLYLTPKEQTITLLYNKPINEKGPIKFEFELFTIILILSSLFGYKLMDYVADFSSVKHKSRVDIVFLCIFFSMLFIPMSHIKQDEISKSENRTLAKWKPLLKNDGTLNYNFGKDFEAWFNDRFNCRKQLVLIKTTKEHKRVLYGKDDWLFYKGSNSIANYRNTKLFSAEELQSLADYLSSIDDYCRKNNKIFYFFIAPDKNKIYGEYYPDYIIKINPDSKSRANQLISYLKANTNINVIYPYEILKQNKDKGLLYYKQDTHWNSFGAYFGYNLLMDEIKKDFPNIHQIVITKYESEFVPGGDLSNMLQEKISPDNTEYTKINPEIKYEIFGNNNKREDLHSDLNINTPKVTMYRDSFSSALIPFLSNTFSSIDYYWRNNVKKDEIHRSDIVIFEKVERELPQLLKCQQIED